MKIGIGNDHAATELKFAIVDYLKELGHEVVNFGTDTNDSCNYPEYGEKVARAVVAKEVDLGILICGTGVGISIAANKVKEIRICFHQFIGVLLKLCCDIRLLLIAIPQIPYWCINIKCPTGEKKLPGCSLAMIG